MDIRLLLFNAEFRLVRCQGCLVQSRIEILAVIFRKTTNSVRIMAINFSFCLILYLVVGLSKIHITVGRAIALAQDNIPPYELNALYDLYMSTSGEDWTWRTVGSIWNFTANCNPCTEHWQGITCNVTEDSQYLHVTRIKLREYNLKGTLPSSLANITRLEVLNFLQNQLEGSIPPELGIGTSMLRILILGLNQLTGTIPSSLGQLKHLEVMLFDDNQLHGTLPSNLGNATALRVLSVELNQLSGQIPSTFGNLTKLEALLVNENAMTGPVPSTLGSLVNLEVFYTWVNRMTGTIPEFFCSMSQLQYFGTYENLMDGTLPACLGQLNELKYLWPYGNFHTGTIPASYAVLPNLELLWICENFLHGTMPSQWNAPKLLNLFAFDNLLSGTLPPSLGNLQSLTIFVVYVNAFSGSIPAELGQLQQLQILEVDNNFLTGTLPTTLSGLTSLTEFYVYNNSLAGSIEGVFNATTQTSLAIIQLSDNHFSGTLPVEAFLPPQLNTFVAVSNCFTGTLPAGICKNKRLVSLILDGLQTAPHCRQKLTKGISNAYVVPNKFNGVIPPCFFSMNLSSLHLSGNDITGSLPDDVTISKSLVDFTASHNALTGTLPSTFQKHVWKNLDVSFNRLTGEISSDFAENQPPLVIILNGISYDISNLTYGASYSLQNNRFSHRVPHALVDLYNVSVLGSNMFACEFDKSDIPKHDQHRSNYQCGSDAFNRPFYIWLALAVLGGVVLTAMFFSTWFAHSTVVHEALVYVRKWSLQHEHWGRNWLYVCAVSEMLCRIGGWCALAIVVVLVPWYSAASHYYGTYTHQYAWVVSAAFLSGNTTTAVQLALYMLLQLFLVVALAYGLVYHDRHEHNRPSRHNTLSKDGRYTYEEDRVAHLALRVSVYALFVLINSVVVGSVNLGFVLIALYRSATEQVIAQVWLSLFKLLWNSVATPYLVRMLSQLVSDNALTTGFVAIHAGTALFNNIAIPCLVVAVVSPSCFYNVFQAAPSVTSTFIYESCTGTNSSSAVCVQYEPELLQSTYDPPFRYDYQCSSSFITYYAPAFVYLAIAASFGMPLLKFVLVQLHKRATSGSYWQLALDLVLPRILRPIVIVHSDGSVVGGYAASNPMQQGQPGGGEQRQSSDSAASQRSRAGTRTSARSSTLFRSRSTISYEDLRRDKFDPFFDANIFVISLLTYLGILLTFGVVFPPLAVAMCVTMLSVAWQGKLAVGRFLHNARELQALKFVDIIEQECKGAVTIPKIRRCVFVIICFSCCFYALFLYDTLGNDVGDRHAYWVLIVLPLFPLCIFAAVLVRARLTGDVLSGLKASAVEEVGEEPGALHLAPLPRRSSAAAEGDAIGHSINGSGGDGALDSSGNDNI